mgnify:FL=1
MYRPKKLSPEEAYRQASGECARRETCRAHWYRKFIAAGLSPLEADDVLGRLEREGFIDEVRYARAYVSDHYRFSQWGREKLRHMLCADGIASAAIEEALKEIDEDVYRENLKSLLEKKIRSADNDDPRTLTRKAVAYAAARGYEADLIFEVFKEIIQEHQA